MPGVGAYLEEPREGICSLGCGRFWGWDPAAAPRQASPNQGGVGRTAAPGRLVRGVCAGAPPMEAITGTSAGARGGERRKRGSSRPEEPGREQREAGSAEAPRSAPGSAAGSAEERWERSGADRRGAPGALGGQPAAARGWCRGFGSALDLRQ